MITIIHPSRSRANKSLETIEKWILKAGTSDLEVIVSIDMDDPEKPLYRENISRIGEKNIWSVSFENKSAIDAINIAAKYSKGDILIVVSDDTDCPDNWAINLLKEVEGKTDWMLKAQDGIQPWLITMPVMDREYYNRFGYIYHHDYQHCFCDTELTCVAELTGRLIKSSMIFKHEHYSVTNAAKDEVSLKADSTYEPGKKIFIDRKKKLFDLPDDQIKGQMSYNHFTIM